MAAKKELPQAGATQGSERVYILHPEWPPRGGRIRYPDDTPRAGESTAPKGGQSNRATQLADFIVGLPNHGKLIDFA